MDHRKLSADIPSETSEQIRQRVVRARQVQVERFRQEGIYCNAQMKNRHIRRYCTLGQDSKALLEDAMDRLGLSARAYSRILKVSRTIADLEGSEEILPHHISEAVQYRMFDRGMF